MMNSSVSFVWQAELKMLTTVVIISFRRKILEQAFDIGWYNEAINLVEFQFFEWLLNEVPHVMRD